MCSEAYVSWNHTILYFCPKCKGHQVSKGQAKCDICGTDLEYPSERNYEKDAKRSQKSTNKLSKHKR